MLQPVKSNQAGIQCDQCEQWYHARPGCCDISPEVYASLANLSCTWLCPQCGLPNFSDSLLDTSLDSLSSSNYFDPLNGSNSEVSPSQPSPNYKSNNDNNTSHRDKRNSKQNKTKQRKLSCLVINCRSLKNKVADIAAVIDEYKPDIILGNESWLNSTIASSEIFPDGDTIPKKDRLNGLNGGGVFQAIKGDVIATIALT